jgi:branched-chain amino acid transport system permease protein
MSERLRTDTSLAAVVLMFGLAGWLMPVWMTSVAAIALAKGIVAVGMLLLLRAGLVPFGHAMYFCIGGYAAGLLQQALGASEILVLLLASACIAGLVAAAVGVLLRRYRGIFFAMLSMAFSMILYGVLIKSQSLGSSDGFSLPRPRLFGSAMAAGAAITTIYAVTLAAAALVIFVVSRYLRTTCGHVGPAIRQNELRLSYLGHAPERVIYLEYIASGFLGGLAGALVALLIGQVDPGMGFWTTSGEFVFIAILGGAGGVWSMMAAAFVLEMVHVLAFNYAPQYWKMVLGVTLLLLIMRFPGGLASIQWRLRAGGAHG